MNLAKRSKCMCLISLLAIAIGYILMGYIGRQQFISLIGGQPREIKKATFYGLGKVLTLADVSSLEYIATQLSKGNKAFPGADRFASDGTLYFSKFIKMDVSYYMSKKGDLLLVAYEESPGFYDYFIVPIDSDTPPKLVELINEFIEEGTKRRKER